MAIVPCRVIAVTGHPSAAVLAGRICLAMARCRVTLMPSVVAGRVVGVVSVATAMFTIVLVLVRAVPSHGVTVIEAFMPAP